MFFVLKKTLKVRKLGKKSANPVYIHFYDRLHSQM